MAASEGTQRQPGHLAPNDFVDSTHPAVVDFAREQVGAGAGEIEAAVALYYAVRDGVRYDPYTASVSAEQLRASTTLQSRRGWCVAKAVLLAACCRCLGIPARLGFADVRNHLSTARVRESMGSDVFYWHGYTQIRLEERWVKATPAFNVELCEKFGLLPLEFDGRNDSLYHPFDREGKRYMEYLHDYGVFDDVPIEPMLATWREHYAFARLMTPDDGRTFGEVASGNFEREVEAERGEE